MPPKLAGGVFGVDWAQAEGDLVRREERVNAAVVHVSLTPASLLKFVLSRAFQDLEMGAVVS